MHRTFFIADTHLNHHNIIKYCDRPFKNKEEMNNTIITNWNKVVGKFDHVFVLGDFAFYDGERILPLLKGIKYLIMGNHDRRKTPRHWLDCGFTHVSKYPILLGQYILSHEPIYTEIGSLRNICAHKHNLGINDPTHFFVSVEQPLINYTPIRDTVIDKYFNVCLERRI
jgi:calcineurin-like phosphoesterase family protein